MAAAPPSLLGGTPRAFLLLSLLLTPGSLCPPPPSSSSPPAPPLPSRRTPERLTVLAEPSLPAAGGSSAAPPCGGRSLQVAPGPTSLEGAVGQELTLECRYRAAAGGGGANVSWYRLCPPAQGCQRPLLPLQGAAGWSLGGEEGRGTLTLLSLSLDHSGLYFCRVEAGGALGRSCGTFVRVRPPRAVPLLNLSERTKEQVLRAQGALLLLSAVGPGLLLLLRQRRARQQQQPQKGPSEEENLYEGLTLDACSMYEDISGGGLQATYQDVGTPQGPPQAPPQRPQTQLEKP